MRVLDGRSYTTSYQFNQANQPIQVTYPSNSRVMSISYDNKGRLQSVADQYRTYVGNINHTGSGQISSYSRGNGLVENFTYDSNRMQMTQQTATLGASTLMNLTYSYQASAGQMGAGSTAGNADQLMSISRIIGEVIESAAYTYDLQERLVTSNQTTNGITAQRRFAYDRWGNRTGMWDAVSGGNQIQSVTLQQSGGVPTNRITSVNNNGQNLNYTYDAAGNVASDGAHSYTYDAENRLVSVDGGVTANYSYDHKNRRYKKVVGAASTHYIWEGGQVIAEYDAGSGAALMNYVSAGGKLIASMGGGILKWYLSDRLSTRLILDNNGNILGRQGHLPYGEEIVGTGDQQKRHFTSYDRDTESGLDYAVNRYYGQYVGRFTSVDPYSGSNDIGNPQSLNRYTYAENDPINLTDPLGLYPWSIINLGGGVNAYRICFSAGENSWCEWRVISEYEPRPGEKKPCSGNTKAPLTGKLLEKYDEGRNIVRDKLQNSEQCRNYLTDHNINPDDALNAVNLQRAYDGSKSDISRLDAGLAPPHGEIPGATAYNRVLNSCVSATFKRQGSKLGAMAAIWPNQQHPSETTVEERSDIYFGQKMSAATILHEALHSLFGVEDPALAELLDVDISKEGSIAITKALKKNGCGD